MARKVIYVELLLAHCESMFSAQGPLLLTFFLAGLTGGFIHCVSMCGPVVACQNMCGTGACNSKFSRMTQFPYHLGRAATYGFLGFFAALLSRQIAASPYWPWVSGFMLATAGLMFIASSLPQCKHALFRLTGKTSFLRGAMLGFMPCGLIYAALMMAATMANPVMAMVAMWLFVLGTIPALLAASIGAEIITQKWQHAMNKAGRAMMAVNGVVLLIMAEKLVR